VKLPRTPEFDCERTRYAFAFTCEECGHFDPARELCRHEYPIDEHRAAAQDASIGTLVFCKEFELA
jgi:hypothetical protein